MILTVGNGGGLTVTVVLSVAESPVLPLVQVIKYVLVEVRGPTVIDPATAWLPLQSPEAVQLVARVEPQAILAVVL